AADGPPRPQPLAALGSFELEVPIRQERITAVVYHGIGDANVIPLQPTGTQMNAGFLTRLTHRLFGGGAPDGPPKPDDAGAAGPLHQLCGQPRGRLARARGGCKPDLVGAAACASCSSPTFSPRRGGGSSSRGCPGCEKSSGSISWSATQRTRRMAPASPAGSQ